MKQDYLIFQNATYSTGDYVYATAAQSSRSKSWHFLHSGYNDHTMMIQFSGSMFWNPLHSGYNSCSTKAWFLELDNDISLTTFNGYAVMTLYSSMVCEDGVYYMKVRFPLM